MPSCRCLIYTEGAVAFMPIKSCQPKQRLQPAFRSIFCKAQHAMTTLLDHKQSRHTGNSTQFTQNRARHKVGA